MKKVDNRLKEEMNRVNHYLDASTEPKIREVVERELITVHMKTLIEVRAAARGRKKKKTSTPPSSQMEHSGLISLLRDDKLEDLSRMYNLFGRVTNGHSLMREMISSYVKETVRGRDFVVDALPHSPLLSLAHRARH
jgi:cullin 3